MPTPPTSLLQWVWPLLVEKREFCEYSLFFLNWSEVPVCREACLNMSCDYVLLLDSLAMLDSPLTLQQLISVGRDVVAPLLVRPEKMFSNFWGDLASDGFYARSRDYVSIIENERR